MRKICEIYDVSKEYEMQENSILVCVSEIEQNKLFSIMPELKTNFSNVFSIDEWQQYLEINKQFHRNESKHRMRELRQSKKLETETSHLYEIDIVDSLENQEFSKIINDFLLQLNSIQRRRFKMYYLENYTYRQIAEKERRDIKSVYESVQAGKKKLLKYFENYPNKKHPTS